MSEQHEYADPADLAEQRAAASDDEESSTTDTGSITDAEVDEADRLEQSTPVSADDDDYPYDEER
jgi:hypothetical protein